MVLDIKAHITMLFGDNFGPSAAVLVVSFVAGLMFFPMLMIRTLVGLALVICIFVWLHNGYQRADRMGEGFRDALAAPVLGLFANPGILAQAVPVPGQRRAGVLQPGTYLLKTDKWPFWCMYMQNKGSANVCAYLGNPGPQGHMKLTKLASGFWLMSPVQWPHEYVYMQDNKEGNICGCSQEPGPQGHWKVEYVSSTESGEDMYRFSTEKWPDCYMYMQDKGDGNVRGLNKEDPGQQGWWIPVTIAPTEHAPRSVSFDPTKFYSLTTEKWSEWYEYMQDNKEGNVRGWDVNPGSQGHWKIIENPKQPGTYLLSSKKWPTCYMYMQDMHDGNVRGYDKEDPGPQGWWIIKKNPLRDDTYLFSTAKWPNHYKYMQDVGSGNVRGHEDDPGPQGWYNICSL